jgi:23S rRNA U2552 (ribose-2'-O)-methylase RlmE/FtsJ
MNDNDNEKLFDVYHPIIYKLDFINNVNILDTSNKVIFSNNIAYPELTLGFNHYIHKTKDKTEELIKFSNKKKIYLVTSLFEKNINKTNSEEEKSIDFAIHKFIKDTLKKDVPRILSRAFLKLWEMIIYFDLISNTDDFVSAHIAEGPGSFIQATIIYRDILEKISKNKSLTNKDKYYGVTLHTDNKHLQIEKDFINYYSKESKKLHIMETISTIDYLKNKDFSDDVNEDKLYNMYGGGFRTNGNITDINTINLFKKIVNYSGGSKDIKDIKDEADLITADGGFDWKDENLQEQEAYTLILGEIITALKIQKNNGNFVIKIFETFTKNTLKFIEILKNYYKEIYICKPFTSRASNSEKYVICKYFIKKKFTKTHEKNLDDMFINISKNKDFHINTIFPDYQISMQDISLYKYVNEKIWLKQYEAINNIISFIKLDNQNGTEYNDFLTKQIEASTFWNSLFLNNINYDRIYNYVNYLFNNNNKNKLIKTQKINKEDKKNKVNKKDKI